MFDIHTHVLPAIDDGPQTLEEALVTVRTLVDEGVAHIIATPHFNDQYPHVSAREVRERVAFLQREVDAQHIKVRLWPGHEIHLDADIEESLLQGQASPLNAGPYVLLELSDYDFPVFLEGLLGQLRTKGFIPIIAHAERYFAVQQQPEILVPLVEAGALLQITASSLVGLFGSHVQQTAELLLRQNLAHVLASDSHSLTFRPPRFAEGIRAAEAIVGSERVHEMVFEVPRAILQGQPVSVPPVTLPSIRGKHRGWLPGR
ncbi:MAG TPA: CpsB/CapC family capsule biosynthesis tyrosine phosphatase [Ktedonosporobacter sp.]|nr:CpsB/CapC family capsule biosynthesis tyrosine phosphatase [Ktedonosporobacter sp.]